MENRSSTFLYSIHSCASAGLDSTSTSPTSATVPRRMRQPFPSVPTGSRRPAGVRGGEGNLTIGELILPEEPRRRQTRSVGQRRDGPRFPGAILRHWSRPPARGGRGPLPGQESRVEPQQAGIRRHPGPDEPVQTEHARVADMEQCGRHQRAREAAPMQESQWKADLEQHQQP